MEPTLAHAISTLLSLVFLGRFEEKRLRRILACDPAFKLKMQTRFDLERVLTKTKAQSQELEKLKTEVQAHPSPSAESASYPSLGRSPRSGPPGPPRAEGPI
jgi:hypothetical protein